MNPENILEVYVHYKTGNLYLSNCVKQLEDGSTVVEYYDLKMKNKYQRNLKEFTEILELVNPKDNSVHKVQRFIPIGLLDRSDNKITPYNL